MFLPCISGITSDGEKEEFINEAKTLEELDLFIPMLKLLERQGNQEEKLLNAEISDLIGRRLHDFDVMGAEVCPRVIHNSMHIITVHCVFRIARNTLFGLMFTQGVYSSVVVAV